jgi:hypothetical protein
MSAATLDLDVVQRRPCEPHGGACMSIEAHGGGVAIAARHVCGDPRAARARTEAGEMAAEARAAGFHGPISVHFPPGTFGAHVVDADGRVVPEKIARVVRPNAGPK